MRQPRSTARAYLLALAILVAPAASAAVTPEFFAALCQVETGGREGAVGDGGRALGPYQIHRAYHADSRVPGPYAHVRDRAYAERVMVAYWRRYCPDALDRGDLQTLARVHNGGPGGHRKRSTLKYWQKVHTELRRLSAQ